MFLLRLCCLLGMFIITPFAFSQVHDLNARANATYQLDPGIPEELFNFTIFTINALCALQAPPGETDIHITMLTHSASVDGHPLNPTEEMDLYVHNGETVTLTAKAGAKVELLNKGQYPIVATCKTV